MKKTAVSLFGLLIGLLPLALLGGDNRPFDRAQRAMKVKDYQAAITICLTELGAKADDYDVNYLLALAYSSSGQMERALERLKHMAELFPDNADVVLFQARIYTRKGMYKEALASYEDVLRFAPDNEEAVIGTGDIAARRGNHALAHETLRRVLDRNPKSAEAYYHLGLLCRWEGRPAQARENFEKAAALAPGNDDYRTILTREAPRLQRKSEFRYQHEIEGWSDGRADFQDDRLSLQFGLPRDAGVAILKYNQTHRFGETDRQFELEAYPRLWAKAYGRVDVGYATPAVSFPRLSYQVELYQGFLGTAEASAGIWRMNFPDRPVMVEMGSLGYYWGQYYPFVRITYSRDQGRYAFSWTLNARRYFSADNYVYAGYGEGSLLFESPTLQDLFANRGRIYLAGAVWYVGQKVRLEFNFTHASESGLVRNTLLLSTGFCWGRLPVAR